MGWMCAWGGEGRGGGEVGGGGGVRRGGGGGHVTPPSPHGISIAHISGNIKYQMLVRLSTVLISVKYQANNGCRE